MNRTMGDVTIQTGQINAVIFPDTGKYQEYIHLMKGPYKPKWTRVEGNDSGHLFQGIRDIEGTDIFFFIHRHEVPQDSKVIYSRIVCNVIPQNKETHRVRLTVGGKKLTY